MLKNPLLAANDKRKEQIVDIGMAIIHLWLKHPDWTLLEVIKNLNETH